jgi:hypothetical protein
MTECLDLSLGEHPQTTSLRDITALAKGVASTAETPAHMR